MTKNDLRLLIGILFCAALAFSYSKLAQPAGNKLVLIQQGSSPPQTLALTKEQTHTLTTIHGTLTFKVDTQGIQVLSAPCPDKLCVQQKKITQTGAAIICLPEQVSLSLVSTKRDAAALDGISR